VTLDSTAGRGDPRAHIGSFKNSSRRARADRAELCARSGYESNAVERGVSSFGTSKRDLSTGRCSPGDQDLQHSASALVIRDGSDALGCFGRRRGRRVRFWQNVPQQRGRRSRQENGNDREIIQEREIAPLMMRMI